MLQPLDEGLWVAPAPLSLYGIRLGTRMTVVRLADGGLWVHSGIPLTPALRAQVDTCRDRRAARRSVDRLLEHDFERVVIAHGDIIARDGRDAVRSTFEFLG